jgi:hypothetical protein
MRKVEDISVLEYLKFINGLHGDQRLDSYVLKPNRVEITRSAIDAGSKYRRVENKYTFVSKKNGNYHVVWIGKNGHLNLLTDEFNAFMGVKPKIEHLEDDFSL